MRCSPRSTTWLASASLVVGACGGTAEAQGLGRQPVDEPSARAAIVAAVRDRIGGGAEVRIEGLVLRAGRDGQGRLVATPEAGVKLGRPGPLLAGLSRPERSVDDPVG